MFYSALVSIRSVVFISATVETDLLIDSSCARLKTIEPRAYLSRCEKPRKGLLLWTLILVRSAR